MYRTIQELKPYFYSLREITNRLSLDIKIPTSWRFQDIADKYELIGIKLQDQNETTTLISLMSSSDEDGCNRIITLAKDIIKQNKEEEEKRRLFDEKVKELQQMFTNLSLDELKNLNFNEENGEDGDRTRIGIDGEGEDQIPKRSGNTKK